eukprot:1159421-Pelagomonas_calceolata.AAC.11
MHTITADAKEEFVTKCILQLLLRDDGAGLGKGRQIAGRMIVLVRAWARVRAGDGAGMGKGRQIAGCIIDSYARGRKQHAWLSISSDLHLDAQKPICLEMLYAYRFIVATANLHR